MRNRILIYLILFMSFFVFSAYNGFSAQSCSSLIQNHINWLKANPQNVVTFMKITSKRHSTPPKERYKFAWVSTAQGSLKLGGGGQYIYRTNFPVVFSDRNNFAKSLSDRESLYLYRNGLAKIVLNSWSNNTFSINNMRCRNNGYIIGTLSEPGSPAEVVIMLQKYGPSVSNPKPKPAPKPKPKPKPYSYKCNLKPDPGPCKALFNHYYFDSSSKSCRSFSYGGCDGVVPFETLNECINSCEGKY